MRTWVEKLAKCIKETGIVGYNPMVTGNQCIRVKHFECKIRHFEVHYKNGMCHVESTKHLEIVDTIDKTYSDIKLYDDECDVLEKAIDYCINNSQDNFIKQLENL